MNTLKAEKRDMAIKAKRLRREGYGQRKPDHAGCRRTGDGCID